MTSVLGLVDEIAAHQFKKRERPSPVGLTALLLGAGREIARLASAHNVLRAQFPALPVRLRYLSNDYPATGDRLIGGDAASSTSDFLAACAAHPTRTLKEWRATKWGPLFDSLLETSQLREEEFERFWQDLDLVLGVEGAAVFPDSEDETRTAQIETLARALATLVVDSGGKDRWSRAELLEAIGWPDRYALRFSHQFPVGAYVQRNEVTEARLSNAIAAHASGYISLVGPPGTGKSTLLQRELRDQPDLNVVRYLAFVPGTAQGQGRGEADLFYDDVNSQLAATGLPPLRLKDDTTRARQQAFDHLLARAGERHLRDGTRYIVVVDGLDHIPREERPDHSLLAALPLPQSVPEGVLIVLGTQRLDLADLPPAVRAQAGAAGRRIDIAALTENAVARMADQLGLSGDISRADIFRVAGGHPLVTRYMIERLMSASPALQVQILAGEHGFGGDLEEVYEAAWRGIEQADQSAAVKHVLILLAHVQGSIAPELMARATSAEAVEQALQQAGHLLDLVPPAGASSTTAFAYSCAASAFYDLARQIPPSTPLRSIERSLA